MTNIFRKASGFTLVEIMVASTVGALMIGLVVMTSTELYKELTAADAYRGIHENARKSMAQISRDIRSGVSVSNTNPQRLTLATVGLTGTTNTVEYFLIPSTTVTNANVLVRVENAAGTITTNSMTDYATYVEFQYWSNPGSMASSDNDTFEVRAYLSITNVGAFRVSSDLLQTRILMRNKHY